ncbi:tyrosine-type recombinase/integrase [Mangrovibacillus cuniculi]|uniref:Tyrosine-type recombinase/integrase n=1 Tax=Mangrovibacillus cuniculi TaxID=2593652 RepID=A0A7S8CCP4_9BACI|nr:tyrosine-type recombinase/integrase [Mangrovibacillus cuniculi]QPC47560.1 tyrosine-type recombinase/integrase [Mangrovibacillus cuniculi]
MGNLENKTVNTSLQKLIDEYLLSLKLSNKAEQTLQKYEWVLNRFFREVTVTLDELTSLHVHQWLQEFSKGKKARTIDLFLCVLSSFFQFCLLEGYMDRVVMKKRWKPKIPHSLPKYLSEEEFARVKKASESFSTRDRALLLFLFSSGCRSAEVSSLKIKDVVLSKRTADVVGKGKKIRQVHFSVECLLLLEEYLDTREIQDEDYLFLNRRNQQLKPDGIYEVVRKIGKRAELSFTLHPHCCRHTFATNMLARGASIEFIADELGHADLNTTRVYARIPTEEMRTQYQNKMG